MVSLGRSLFVLAVSVLAGCSAPGKTRPVAEAPPDNRTSTPLAQSSPPPSAPEANSTPPPDVSAWRSMILGAMQEPVLNEDPGNPPADTVRFLYVPTFDNPIVIRIQDLGTEVILVRKRLSGKGGYDPGELDTISEETIDEFAWNTLRDQVGQSGFWDLPTEEAQEVVYDNGMVGRWRILAWESWILEVVQGGKYHRVIRQSPSDAWYRDCAEFRKLCVSIRQVADNTLERLP